MSTTNNAMPHSLAPPNAGAAIPLDGREYEFFVTTGQPHQPDGASRATIRRVVMRNFFNDKNSNSQNERPASAISSSSTVQAGSNLRGRFRLPKPGQAVFPEKPRSPPKLKPRKSLKQDAVATNVSADARQAKKSKPVSKNLASITPGRGSRPAVGSAIVCSARPINCLRRNPNAHRYDPFDVLPIPGSSKIELLFSICKLDSPALRRKTCV